MVLTPAALPEATISAASAMAEGKDIESQVLGAYADFCREVGALNELLTDNSKVQVGIKFTGIDSKNMTPHVYLTPHCQNQDPSKCKIQDVKHTAIMILYTLLSLLKFWCYAIKYAVDCLNHTSKKGLSWHTAKE
eukprot:10751906-Ditylum_brightwellii.AAC.1